MWSIINRRTALIVISLVVISILVFGLNTNKFEKPKDRIRIKQTVDYNSFMGKSEYYLKTEVFINDKLTIGDTDFGTYKEIDSLKCIRYREIKEKADNLYKLRNKKCN
jgi:hypothetical protein